MSKLRGKRPSPALVISILALFVALGGSAYAAKKIGTKEIKANAITTGKIKKNAVTTSKIKNEAVTGAKINETSLGTVPSASHATSADTATNATNFSRYFTSGLKKASIGQSVTVLSIGPFTFTGKCTDAGGGRYKAAVYATTSQPGSNVYSTEHGGYYENNFNPGEEQQVDYGADNTGPELAFLGSSYSAFTAQSADGSLLIEGNGNSAVHAFGADCAFQIAGFNNA